MNDNLNKFNTILAAEYVRAYAKFTPAELARKMTLGLDNGNANKDGQGIKNACKILGIPHTYKAIRAFLTTGA